MSTLQKTKLMEAFRLRMIVFMGMIGVAGFIIFVQLVNLQFVQGREYQERARNNMENYIPITASRGEFYDRHFKLQPAEGEQNRVIATNRASFNITTIPAKFADEHQGERTVRDVCALLGADAEVVLADMKKEKPSQRFTIQEDVPFTTIVRIASHPERFPNIDWEDVPIRVYNEGPMFAHVVGYIGSLNADEYKTMKDDGYKYYQKVGKAGIEKQYDKLLRGVDGFVRRIVDVKNRMEGEEIGEEPLAGNNVVLTIDYEVQKAAYDALGDYSGSAIAIKASTGEVITLLSKPNYDPNQIISRSNAVFVQQMLVDENRPFLNRVIQSKYPPASTFKLMTALAALEEEKWRPETIINCPGSFILKGYIDKEYLCHHIHGPGDMIRAIGQSCNVYFYNVGQRVGPTALMKYCSYFGLDDKTGIDLPGEISGFVPSQNWKRRVYSQSWYDGDTINMSIGQGFLNVTPIGMANFICGLVNNGIVYKPGLLKEVRTPDNRRVVSSFERTKLHDIPLSEQTTSVVKQGMRQAVTSGTAALLSLLPVQCAGKTGTAQTRSSRTAKSTQHAWFVGFAPFDGPPEKAVVVVVMVEYGVAGAATAVPVADRMFAKMQEMGYFNAEETQ